MKDINSNVKKQHLLVICGVKNSGKTTLITNLIPKFTQRGYKVATVKHDGHDFEADVKGTDTYKHQNAGAYGTAVFSKNKFMVVKKQKDTTEDELINLFPEADIIFLEGFKKSSYPKLEIVRDGNSFESVCNKENLIAILSDIKDENKIANLELESKIIDLNNIDEIVEYIIKNLDIN